MFKTTIQSHGDISTTAEETYGHGEVILRIGNGGAGATGLVAALANDYLARERQGHSIVWVCNHSRNTQIALLNKHINLALTYERDQEKQAIDEGWAISAGCVFHDHFCLVGPLIDPANVGESVDIFDALRRIAESRSNFHSRADFSATMIKERSIWKHINLEPWSADDEQARDWYIQTLYSPAKALEIAAASGAYLLTDRSTLLRQAMLGTIRSVTAFYEPESVDSILMNSCYAMYNAAASPKELEEVRRFLQYVQSGRGQGIIHSFGETQAGMPLFAKVAVGFSTVSIVGGRPTEGRWAQGRIDKRATKESRL